MKAVSPMLAALGGAIGAGVRFVLGHGVHAIGWPAWTGTLVANLVGAALCGVLAGLWMERHGSGWRWRGDRWQREVVAVGGFCGGLTTLSALSDDAAVLWRTGHAATAVIDLALHGVAGCFVCALGFLLARRWVRARYCAS